MMSPRRSQSGIVKDFLKISGKSNNELIQCPCRFQREQGSRQLFTHMLVVFDVDIYTQFEYSHYRAL